MYADNFGGHKLRPSSYSHIQFYFLPPNNAPAHKAKVNLEWFKSQKINVMDWPAQSPDSNPIENLWVSLSRMVYSGGKQYDSKEELKNAITRCWALITSKETKPLIESMQNRVFELIRLNGLKTHY
jgi:hypothetical protein